ncbi:DUF6390 family protein [Mycobacterium marinum]|uniref:Uncharacterized protein n=1 Tax=Mycobacterium marinum (strain ATCC BAA-535 / M) TaxID=216594 RepID=B2HJR9_MYCMM|nr:DUF6390 family protein [Mycobacterium marinum]ACC40305.1 hypothetical protein MMAR_1856 [Mycobacterium marinum M]MDC8970637.1 DUF6390 family protein [Mycobacterium marinum]MDC9003572.1 DUF6390 family protein [Mycobacterium marinum]QQW35056.1 hypothetical protein HXW97_15310 [Mycobacterium marinum]GJO26722.1 hypothetical protein NJB1507_31590 [Mycobacterium marinum]
MSVPDTPDIRGPEMFARYAYAPNALGYCGPPLGATLRDGSVADVRAAARKFSGAWPYLRVLSRLTGIADPLDYRLVEAYWLGGGVGADVEPGRFFDELLAIIGPQAGRYWSHLTPELAHEAAGNHCFHVFGVYPWTRFLGRGLDEHPLSVLDSCRITWATVVSRTGDAVEVSRQSLIWDGEALALAAPSSQLLDVWADGYSAVPDVSVGEEVAVHWGRLCARLQPEQVVALAESTHRQLRVTNQRLARV